MPYQYPPEIHISAPLMQSVWFWNTSYIIPNMDTIVCGGTAQVDDWNLTESVDDTKTIMEDICALFPSITQAPVVCSVPLICQFPPHI